MIVSISSYMGMLKTIAKMTTLCERNTIQVDARTLITGKRTNR